MTKAAEILSVSKMSITRCFDELEALDVSYLSVQNRSRYFSADSDKKAMWKNIREFLRDPVIKTYALKNKPSENLPLSGETALVHYSMLDYGPYPFLAIRKNQIKILNLSAGNIVSAGEDPGCIVQELGYWIPFKNEVALDPLTTALSISSEAKEDPRISKAIDEMLEEYVW